MIEEILTGIPFFSSLPSAELKYLSEVFHIRELPAKAIIFEEGGLAECFYILIKGQVEVIKAYGTSDERQLSICTPGDFLGEMSFFNKEGTHTASVQALEPVALLELSQAEFDFLLGRQPALAYDMLRVVSTRLSQSENATINDLREKNRQLLLAYQALQEAQMQLIEKEKLEQELEVARNIQRSILPSQVPQRQGFIFDVVMAPMRAVGGDLYDFIPLGKDKLGIAVGDVSDHGVPAALFMALTTTLLRAEARRARSPGEVLQRVNQQLLDFNNTGMYATLLYGILNIDSHEFHYCRAGHELPLLLEGDGKFKPIELQAGMPIGIVDQPELDEQTIVLKNNSILLIYTDGLTDALSTAQIAFGKDRLKDVLREDSKISKGNLCQRILDRVQSFSYGTEQFDDIALLTICVE